MIKVGYPTRDEERADHGPHDRAGAPRAPSAVVDAEQIARRRAQVVREIYIDDKIKRLHRRRRPRDARARARYGLERAGRLDRVRRQSPRASIASTMAARAHAFLRHRGYVTPEDVKAIGPDVLRHRVVLTYEAEAEEVTAEDVVRARVRARRGAVSAPSAPTMLPPRAAQEDPQDRDRHRRGSSTSSWPGSTTRCSRAAAWRSPRCASTSPATTSAPSTGTSRRA